MRLGGQPGRPEVWEAEASQQLLPHIVIVSGQLPWSLLSLLIFQGRGVKGPFMGLCGSSVNESTVRTIYLIWKKKKSVFVLFSRHAP